MVLSGILKNSRSISRAALGVALAMGVVAGTTFTASPAVAAKKKKKPKAPKLNFSKGFVAVAGPAQNAIAELDVSNAEAATQAKSMLEQAFGAVEVDDDRFLVGTLAVNLGGKLEDTQMQRRGFMAMLASGKSEPASVPRYNSIVGQLAYQAGDYAEAHQYLQRGTDAGFTDENSHIILAESYIGDNQPAKGLAILHSAIVSARASGTKSPKSWYLRGIGSAFNAKMPNEAADFGALLISDFSDPENVSIAVTVLRELGTFGSQETLDLMRLIGRTNSYAEENDYVEYIQAADPRRLPGEVIKVIDNGLASGMLKTSDPFVADAKRQASGRLASDKASLPSFERDARKAGASEATVTGSADALLSYGQAGKAEAIYQIALGTPGVDAARVLTRLGISQIDQGKYPEALQTLARVTGKRQGIAKLWSAYASSKATAATAAVATSSEPAN